MSMPNHIIGQMSPPRFFSEQGIQGGQAVNDSGQINFPQSVLNQLPLMKVAFVPWVRINFRMGASFSSWTPQLLALYDTIIDAYKASNFNIMGLLSNETGGGVQTDWVANNHEQLGGSGDNSYLQNFAATAFLLAAHFYPRIRMWEVWNEPDAWTSNPSDAIYTGGSFIYPSNFAWLLKHCSDSIKSFKSDIEIVSGGLFVNDLGPSIGSFDNTYYIPNFLNYGQVNIPNWGQPFDYFGEHIYIDQGGNTTPAHMQTACDVVRNTYVPFIGPGIKTIITEYGWTTSSVIQSVQAANIQTALQVFASNQYIKRSFLFAVQDTSGGSYGLFDTFAGGKQSIFPYLQYSQY